MRFSRALVLGALFVLAFPAFADDHDGIERALTPDGVGRAESDDMPSGTPHEGKAREPGAAKTSEHFEVKRGQVGIRFRPGDLGTGTTNAPAKDDAEKLFNTRFGFFQGGKQVDACDTSKGKICCHVTVFHEKKEEVPEFKWGEPVETWRTNVRSFVKDEESLVLSFRSPGKGGTLMCTRYGDPKTTTQGWYMGDIRDAFGKHLAINRGGDDGGKFSDPMNPLSEETRKQAKLNDELFEKKDFRWLDANKRLRALQAIGSKQEALYTDGLRILDQYKDKLADADALAIRASLAVMSTDGNLGPSLARGQGGASVEGQMVAGQAALETRLREIEARVKRD